MRVQGPESRVQGKGTASPRPPAPLALRGRVGRTVPVRGACLSPSRRLAFTLTELLVVIMIMIILTTLTVSAYNFSMSSERSRSAARGVQSYLEGARDRAIYSGEPRGVRFLVDRDNPRTVSSMVYIGESEPWTQGVIRLERLDDDDDKVADGPDVVPVSIPGPDLEQRQTLGVWHEWQPLRSWEHQVEGAEELLEFDGELGPKTFIPEQVDAALQVVHVVEHRRHPVVTVPQLRNLVP